MNFSLPLLSTHRRRRHRAARLVIRRTWRPGWHRFLGGHAHSPDRPEHRKRARALPIPVRLDGVGSLMIILNQPRVHTLHDLERVALWATNQIERRDPSFDERVMVRAIEEAF